MNNDKNITKTILELNDLKEVVGAYAELASTRIKQTRNRVLFARQFLAGIGNVFESVRYSYARAVSDLAKQRWLGGRTRKAITFLPHNGKTVAVFLSANSRLYGDLLNRIFELFMQEVRMGSEATIVGRVGMAMFREVEASRQVTYFDLPDEKIDSEKIKELVFHLVPYESINVYYGRYFDQGAPKAAVFNLTSEIKVDNNRGKAEAARYIFEPDLEEVLKYFEKEIFRDLFEQTVKEAQLAKFATRLITMSAYEENVSESLVQISRQELLLKHRTENLKRLNDLGRIYRQFD